MNGLDIIKKWLKDNHYDGLGCEECSCFIDDLCPCNESPLDCEAGYRIDCPKDETCDCGGFHIDLVKPKK